MSLLAQATVEVDETSFNPQKNSYSTQKILKDIRHRNPEGSLRDMLDNAIARLGKEKIENKNRSVSDTSQEERQDKSRKTGSFREQILAEQAGSESTPQSSNSQGV